MTLNRLVQVALSLVVLVGLPGAPGHAAFKSERGVERRFPLGLTYVSGFKDVVDYHEERFGTSTDFALPVGIQFAPYIQFAHGSRIEFAVGPLAGILAQVRTSNGFSTTEDNYSYWDFPVGLGYGFTFLPNTAVSPYASVGLRYHLVSGDFVKSSSPGFFGAVGLEIARKKRVGFGLEAGYDGSEVTLEGADYDVLGNFIGIPERKVRLNDVTFSFRVIF